jgi:hypothetical protein
MIILRMIFSSIHSRDGEKRTLRKMVPRARRRFVV